MLCCIVNITTPTRAQKGQYVYVLSDSGTAKSMRVSNVLEIREGHCQCWLHVIWMYHPEELPDGRQGYHSERELIGSNHEGLVNSSSVDGIAEVGWLNEWEG